MTGSYKRRAEYLAGNTPKVIGFISRIFPRLRWLRFTVLVNYIGDIKLFALLVRDYFTQKYTAVPYRSIIAIISFLLYLVSPIDFLPDFIPFLGFVDDLMVFRMVMKQVRHDLDAYDQFRNSAEKGIK